MVFGLPKGAPTLVGRLTCPAARPPVFCPVAAPPPAWPAPSRRPGPWSACRRRAAGGLAGGPLQVGGGALPQLLLGLLAPPLHPSQGVCQIPGLAGEPLGRAGQVGAPPRHCRPRLAGRDPRQLSLALADRFL